MRWIDRLFQRPKQNVSEMGLAELIAKVADEPTIKNRNAFYRAVVHSKLGLRLNEPMSDIPPGQSFITGQEIPLKVSTAMLPNGMKMLMAVCDTVRIWQINPNDHYIEMDAKVILQMALKDDYAGVMVRNGDSKDSWGGIPVADILDILNGKYG